MERERNLVKEYLRNRKSPKFYNFTVRYGHKIRSLSSDYKCYDAFDLQYHWIDVYNSVIAEIKPKLTLQAKGNRKHMLFEQIHDRNFKKSIAELKSKEGYSSDEADDELFKRYYGTPKIERVTRASKPMVIPAVTSDDEDPEDSELNPTFFGEHMVTVECEKEVIVDKVIAEKGPVNIDLLENGKDTDEQEDAVVEGLSIAVANRSPSPTPTLDNKDVKQRIRDHRAMNPIACRDHPNYTDVCNIMNSNCFALINDEMLKYYESLLSSSALYNILIKDCKQQKEKYQSANNLDITNMINQLFDELLQFRFDQDDSRLVTFFDDCKHEEKNKKSDYYQLLCIVSTVVHNFYKWDEEDEFKEISYMNLFQQILDYLFASTNLITRDNENECKKNTAKRLGIANGRFDLLVLCTQEKEKMQICANEFKRPEELSKTALASRQMKNIRINSSILGETHQLLNDTSDSVVYMDVVGRTANFMQIFRSYNYYVAHKIGSLTIPKSILELELFFRQSLIKLYIWKANLIQLSNKLKVAHIQQTLNVAKDSDDIIEATTLSDSNNVAASSSQVTPINVRLSSSPRITMKKKRKRDVIDWDYSV